VSEKKGVVFRVIFDILISSGSETGTLTSPYLRMFEINGMWFAAAELAGLDRLTFLASLHRYGVPAINLRSRRAFSGQFHRYGRAAFCIGG